MTESCPIQEKFSLTRALHDILCCDLLEESDLKEQERVGGRGDRDLEGWMALFAESPVGLLDAGTGHHAAETGGPGQSSSRSRSESVQPLCILRDFIPPEPTDQNTCV